MRPIPVPKNADEQRPGTHNKTFAAPNGDLTSTEVAPIEVKVTPPGIEDEPGFKLHTYWKLDADDLKMLENGAFLEFTIWADHLHPIGASVWGILDERS